MAEDRREAILVRLVELAKAVFGDTFAFRNQTEVPEEKRPSAVILDSDETRSPPGENADRRRPANSPVLMQMEPEVIVLDQDQDEKIGTSLNIQRAKYLKAILTDQTLADLCHEIRYEGLTTALGMGRAMEGQAQLHLTFVYHLRIDQL